jgi:hypothetical protein
MLSADHGQERMLLEVAHELEEAEPFPRIDRDATSQVR